MGENFTLDFTPQCHHLRWLTEHLDGWQFGEQGLIDAVADALKLGDGMFVEYGAGDGEELPLTLERFAYKSPEQVFLVEIDDDRRFELHRKFPFCTPMRTLDWNAQYIEKPDVVVIDIDGQDSVVMRQMIAAGVRPTLLVVEHFDNHYPIGSTVSDTIPPWMLGLKLESGHAIQDTAETLHAIAAQNGYDRIGFNRCNSFFVVKERYTDLFR